MNLLDHIKTIAPAVAGSLLGPLGAAAATVIADKLGVDKEKLSNMADSFTMTPDVKAKLMELDIHEKEMATIEVDKDKLEIADRDSARAREREMIKAGKTDYALYVIAGIIIVGFFALLYVMFQHPLPEANKDAALLLFGAITGSFLSVIAYFFGSSAGSRAKNELIANRQK
jgi:hypothetical protein